MSMEKVLYYVLTRFFMAIALFVISSLSVSAQRFETHKVFLPDNVGLTRTIKIKPATKFSIKKDNRYTWAKYEEQKAAVIISLNANTSNNNRSCNFVLLDETNTPVDTLEVIQLGKVSTTVSKVAGSSTTRSKSSTSTKKTSSSSSKSTGGQCAAMTKKGTRCTRKASAGSIYCWQHNK